MYLRNDQMERPDGRSGGHAANIDISAIIAPPLDSDELALCRQLAECYRMDRAVFEGMMRSPSAAQRFALQACIDDMQDIANRPPLVLDEWYGADRDPETVGGTVKFVMLAIAGAVGIWLVSCLLIALLKALGER